MSSTFIEGDDEVVAEYDVFLSTGLAGDVHVFQFPLRPFSRPYEASAIDLSVSDGVVEVNKRERGRGAAGDGGSGLGSSLSGIGGFGASGDAQQGVTPNPSPSSRFHMKCTLDVFNSENFLPQVARTDETMHNYEYALGSAPFISRSTYSIGLLKEDGLHLCPVQSIQQFTPKVRSLVKERMAVPPTESPYEAVGPQHRSTIEGGGGPTGTSSSNLRARDREMVKGTRSYMLNADAATSQPLVFYPADSSESGAKRSLLTCSTITPSLPKAGAVTPANTTDAYFPQDELLDVSAEVAKKYVLRPGGARRQDHIADIVRSAQVVTAEEVAEAMTLCGYPNLTEAELVPMLREHALYIHGVWVSRLPGVRISFPQLREVILAQFVASPNGRVYRANLNAMITRRDPALLNSIHSILSTIAILEEPLTGDDHGIDLDEDEAISAQLRIEGLEVSPTASRVSKKAKLATVINSFLADPLPGHRIWRLKKTATKETIQKFAANFPQDFEFQRIYWERRRPMIAELIAAINMGRELGAGAAAAMQGGGGAAAAVARPTPAQPSASLNSATAAPNPASAAANGTGVIAGAAPAAGGVAGVLPSNTTQEEVWISSIRSYVRTIFAEHGVIVKSTARQAVQARSRDPRSPFYMATPTALGTACRLELESFTDSTFILQSANVPEVDLYRKYIIVAAKEKQQFGSADVVDRAQRLIESDFANRGAPVPPELQTIPRMIASRVISEIAEYKQGERLWHLKTGLVENLF